MFLAAVGALAMSVAGCCHVPRFPRGPDRCVDVITGWRYLRIVTPDMPAASYPVRVVFGPRIKREGN